MPRPDPSLDPFRSGLAVLSVDGKLAGHIAAEVTTFWGPARLFGLQWNVWLVVVWADGTKERAVEEYPPWEYVAEMKAGFINWVDSPTAERNQRYDVRFLPPEEGRAARHHLGIVSADF